MIGPAIVLLLLVPGTGLLALGAVEYGSGESYRRCALVFAAGLGATLIGLYRLSTAFTGY